MQSTVRFRDTAEVDQWGGQRSVLPVFDERSSPFMESTRVDAKRFLHAVSESLKEMESVEARIARFAPLLTVSERKRYIKGKPDVIAAAAALVSRAKSHPVIVAAAEFDAAAVSEDLANLAALEKLEQKLAEIQQRLADARLAWEAEVMVPVLDFYGAARHPARTDAELAATIKPVRDALSTPRNDRPKVAADAS